MDRFIHLAMVAGTEAVEDSGWVPETEDDHCATGVMIGSGIGGLETIYNASILVHEGKGAPAVAVLHSLGAQQPRVRAICRSSSASKGRTIRVVTACATGVHAIGDASRLIALGRRGRHAGRRGGGRRCAKSASPGSARPARCPPGSMTAPPLPRVPGTRTATAS